MLLGKRTLFVIRQLDPLWLMFRCLYRTFTTPSRSLVLFGT